MPISEEDYRAAASWFFKLGPQEQRDILLHAATKVGDDVPNMRDAVALIHAGRNRDTWTGSGNYIAAFRTLS